MDLDIIDDIKIYGIQPVPCAFLFYSSSFFFVVFASKTINGTNPNR